MNYKLSGNAETEQVFLNGKLLDPEESLKVINHSSTGFSWGYEGSGPAQLALAILLEINNDPEGYQEFKRQVIAALPLGENFNIDFEFYPAGMFGGTVEFRGKRFNLKFISDEHERNTLGFHYRKKDNL